MNNHSNSVPAVRAKRPRIYRASVLGESEKVDILYEVALVTDGTDKPKVDKKFSYTIQTKMEMNKINK